MNKNFVNLKSLKQIIKEELLKRKINETNFPNTYSPQRPIQWIPAACSYDFNTITYQDLTEEKGTDVTNIPKENKLFVYGTLRKDYSPIMLSSKIPNTKFVDYATIRGKMYDMGYYPVLLLNSNSTVYGEVYIFDNPIEAFRKLDIYEVEGILYDRVRVNAKMKKNGTIENIWVYIFKDKNQAEKSIEIRSGDYVKYMHTFLH